MDSASPSSPVAKSSQLEKPKSKFLVLRDRILSPHLKEYRPQAAAVAAATRATCQQHGDVSMETGNTCCHLSLYRSDGSSSTESDSCCRHQQETTSKNRSGIPLSRTVETRPAGDKQSSIKRSSIKTKRTVTLASITSAALQPTSHDQRSSTNTPEMTSRSPPLPPPSRKFKLSSEQQKSSEMQTASGAAVVVDSSRPKDGTGNRRQLPVVLESSGEQQIAAKRSNKHKASAEKEAAYSEDEALHGKEQLAPNQIPSIYEFELCFIVGPQIKSLLTFWQH